jgi:hypothetical protein
MKITINFFIIEYNNGDRVRAKNICLDRNFSRILTFRTKKNILKYVHFLDIKYIHLNN